MTIFWRFFLDKRRWIVWWCVGGAAFTLLSIAFYPAFKEFSQLDEQLSGASEGVKALIGGQGGISLISPQGFLHSQIYAQMLPILLLVFAIGLGSRAIAGAEGDGTLEMLLSNPVTRRRVVLGRYATIIVQLVVLGAVVTGVVLAFAPLVQLDGLSIANVIGASVAAVCFGIVHGSIAFAVGAANGKRGMAIAISAAVAVGGFIVFGLVSGGIIEPLRFLTPWWWYVSGNIVAYGMPPEAVWTPLVVSAIAVAGGVALFERRDLRGSD